MLGKKPPLNLGMSTYFNIDSLSEGGQLTSKSDIALKRQAKASIKLTQIGWLSLSYSAKILQIQESSSSFHFPDFSLKTPDFNFSTLEIFKFLKFSVFQPSKSSNFQSLIFDFFQLSRFDFLIYSTYNFQNSSVFQPSKSFKV